MNQSIGVCVPCEAALRAAIIASIAGCTLSVSPMAARAQLLGASVTGSVRFSGGTINFFDPHVGYVPAGYANAAGTTVTIAEPVTEYGFDDGFVRYTANFNDTQLIVGSVLEMGTAHSMIMTFSSPAFTGESLFKSADGYPNGGITASLVGNTMTLSWPGGTGANGTSFQAVYNISSAASTPEPASLALWATALPFGATAILRRWRAL